MFDGFAQASKDSLSVLVIPGGTLDIAQAEHFRAMTGRDVRGECRDHYVAQGYMVTEVAIDNSKAMVVVPRALEQTLEKVAAKHPDAIKFKGGKAFQDRKAGKTGDSRVTASAQADERAPPQSEAGGTRPVRIPHYSGWGEKSSKVKKRQAEEPQTLPLFTGKTGLSEGKAQSDVSQDAPGGADSSVKTQADQPLGTQVLPDSGSVEYGPQLAPIFSNDWRASGAGAHTARDRLLDSLKSMSALQEKDVGNEAESIEKRARELLMNRAPGERRPQVGPLTFVEQLKEAQMRDPRTVQQWMSDRLVRQKKQRETDHQHDRRANVKLDL